MLGFKIKFEHIVLLTLIFFGKDNTIGNLLVNAINHIFKFN